MATGWHTRWKTTCKLTDTDAGVNLHDIAGVLSEESVMGAPDKGDDLQQAPILGEELLKVDNLLQEDSLASGAGSVQDLQRKIEALRAERVGRRIVAQLNRRLSDAATRTAA